jgi:t-SNARE complex subunit (syntaxin)
MSYINLPENNVELRLIEYDHEQFLKDREEEIITTSENVVKINTIFSDLANIVSSQQDNIDDIENNITSSLSKTEDGVVQLNKAKNYQKITNKCCLYLLCFVLFFLFLLILYIFLL